jgi:hypothetical protein
MRKGEVQRGQEMAGRPTVLTEIVMTRLVERIRDGAFDWVAAEAAGIGRRTFYRWMERGERGEEAFIELAVSVRQARAEARIGAEHWVRQHDPLSWLRFGPGRERRGRPGWTQPAKGPDQAPEQQAGEEDVELMEEVDEALREADAVTR